MAEFVRGLGDPLTPVASSDRLVDHVRPSSCLRRQKGGPDHVIGRSRDGLSANDHAVVDEGGLPVRLLITPGQSSDKTVVPNLLAGLPEAKFAASLS